MCRENVWLYVNYESFKAAGEFDFETFPRIKVGYINRIFSIITFPRNLEMQIRA